MSGAAFAAAQAEKGGTRSKGEERRLAAPLFYRLPALRTPTPALEIQIVQDQHVVIRESFALPAAVLPGSVLDVLATHPTELNRLRSMEAKRAGSFRIVALAGDRAVGDDSFASVDSESALLGEGANVVGEPRQVDVNFEWKPKLAIAPNGMGPDPDCEAVCYQEMQDCYDRCDERGWCGYCSNDYSWCVQQCPQVCTEPKSTSTYQTYVVTAVYHYNIYTCASVWYGFPNQTTGDRWEEVLVYYTVYTWQRTTHCDNTYTDTLTGTGSTSGWCWYDTNESCSPPTQTPPYPDC